MVRIVSENQPLTGIISSSESGSESTFNKASRFVKGIDIRGKSSDYIERAKSINWKSVLLYTLSLSVIVIVISIIIHYTIMPIYKVRPGAAGYILINNSDNGKLYWDTTASELHNNNSILSNSSHNYTLLLDIYIKQPLTISDNPRILFHRGENPVMQPSVSKKTTSILGLLKNYNVCMALLPDTNDLLISVLNSDNNMENVILYNVPIQQSFRIGIVLVDRFIEVYLNGELVRTRQLTSPPKHVLGNFFPPENTNSLVATVGNLHIWNSILTPAEIKESTPKLFQPENGLQASCSSPLTSILKKI